MTAKVEVVMSAKDAELVAAWQRARNNVAAFDSELEKINGTNAKLEASGRKVWDQTRTPLEKYNAEVQRLGELLKEKAIDDETHARAIQRQKDLYNQATNSSKSYLSGLSSGTMQVLAGLTGIGTVIGGIMAVATQLRAEYQNLVSRQKTAADRQIDTAAAQRAAIGNLGQDPNMSVAQLNEQVAKISAETGVNQKDIFEAASSALSARGQLSAQDALDSVRLAALNAPDDVAGLKTMSGSLLDMQKKGGGTTTANIGMFIAAKQAARVETNQAFSQNIIPAATGVQEFGDSPQQALALTAAITQGMGDTQGAMSGTAAISLAQQLERALPKSKFRMLQSTVDRIRFLQSEEGKKHREKLIGTDQKKGPLELEKKAFAPIRGLLAGDNTVQAQQLDTALQTIPTGQAAEDVFTANLATVNAQDIQKTAALNRLLGTTSDNLSIKDIGGGRSSVAREGLQKLMKAEKVSDLGQKIMGAKFEASTQLGGGQDPLEFLQKQAASEGTRLSNDVPAYSNPYGPGGTPAQKRSAEEKATGADLLALSEKLQQMIDQQRRQSDLQEKQLAAQQEANRQPVEVNVQVNGQPGGRDATPTKTRPAAALNAGGGG